MQRRNHGKKLIQNLEIAGRVGNNFKGAFIFYSHVGMKSHLTGYRASAALRIDIVDFLVR